MTLIHRWKQTALHNKALVISGVLVAFGTLFYAGAAIVQICILRQSARQTSEQTEQLVKEADRIAKSLEDTLTQNKSAVESSQKNATTALSATIEQFHLEQRAWLGISRFEIIRYNPQPFRMEIRFSNSGKTPALHLRLGNRVSIYNTYRRGPLRSDAQAYHFIRFGTTPPQAEEVFIVDDSLAQGIPISPVLAVRDSKLQAKTNFLYIYGEIKYDDVFGTSHTTTYCFMMDDPKTHALVYCEAHNEMR